MKSLLSKLLISLSVLGVIIGGCFIGLHINEKKKVNMSAEKDVVIQEKFSPQKKLSTSINNQSENTKSIPNLNWEELQREYKDIVAWISIPGTSIDYPILQTTDNQFYLNHDYNSNPDFLGSIFMDYRQKSDFSEFNTIVYGHNVYIDSPSPKFGELNNYYDNEFFDSHKDVYLFTPIKVYKGEVFAVHADSAKSKSNNIDISNENELLNYVEFMKNESLITSNRSEDTISKVMTLWSCAMTSITDSNGRYTDEDKSRTFVSIALDEIN